MLEVDTNIKINGKTYGTTDASIKELLENYTSPLDAWEKYNDFKIDEDLVLKNPQVPTFIIYSQSTPTAYYSEWEKLDVIDKTIPDYEKQPMESFHNEQKTIYRNGDGIILTQNIIMPSLKWAYEHEQGIDGAYPVKLVNYCPTQRTNSWKGQPDDILEDDEISKKMFNDKNEQFEIGCKFLNGSGSDQSNQHGQLESDAYIVSTVMKIALNGEVLEKAPDLFEKLDDRYKNTIMHTCITDFKAFFNTIVKEQK